MVLDAPAPTVTERSKNFSLARPGTPVLLALVACLICGYTRLAHVLSSRAFFSGDEAAVGIMVRNILHGKRYIFFAGQAYGGTLEPYIQAAAYWVLRMPQNPTTLRLPLIGLNMLSCLLIYLCGARMLRSEYHAVIAALLYAVGPWYNVTGGTIDLGFYAISQLLGAAGLYCGLRYSAAQGNRVSELGWTAAFGLCCGLALWNSLTSAYLLIPTAVWLLPKLLRSLTAVPTIIAGTALGALPVIIWMIEHQALPSIGPKNPPTNLQQRYDYLREYVLKQHLGFGVGRHTLLLPSPWRELWLPVFTVLAVGFAVAIYRQRRSLLALVLLRKEPRSGRDILIIAMPIIFGLYLSQKSSWVSGTPRSFTPPTRYSRWRWLRCCRSR